MKHLRQYEAIEELKKYAIWRSKAPDKYEIIEILSKTNNVEKNDLNRHTMYTCKVIYYYDKFTDKILEMPNQFTETFFNSGIPLYVKYTSNNLEDCKEMVLSLTSANKFNL